VSTEAGQLHPGLGRWKLEVVDWRLDTETGLSNPSLSVHETIWVEIADPESR
jgi:hypothetical protein